jgi:hypothetical protein
MLTILVPLVSVFAYGRLTKTRSTKATYAIATAAAFAMAVVTRVLLVAYADGQVFMTDSAVDTFNATAQGLHILVGITTGVLVAKFRRVDPTAAPGPEALAGEA